MENGKKEITLGTATLAVTLPSWADREDLVIAWSDASKAGDGSALRRVAAAALGLCTPVGRRSGCDFAAHKCDVRLYGGAVYSHLRERGVPIPEVMARGGEVIGLCAAALFPRESEVKAKADFTGPPGEPVT